MMSDGTFERIVSDWFHTDAEHRVPDHLDVVLRMTSVAPQRPAWSSLERWLPMDTTFTGRVAPAFRPVGPLFVAVLLALALMAALLIVGSHPQPPPPFGPARTGLTVRADGGDIYLVAPVSRERTKITSGPDWDTFPGFSRDGTKLVFLRRPSEAAVYSSLLEMNADGSGLRTLTQPLEQISSGDWSGDGSYIALTSLVKGISRITVIDLRDGSSKDLDVGLAAEFVSFLPPDGREIVFRGVSPLPMAVWAVRPDGSDLHLLTPRDGALDSGYQDPVVSPDGRLLAYASWDDAITNVVHVRDLVSGSTWEIPKSGTFDDRSRPQFSPDGRSLLMFRSIHDAPAPTFDGVAQLVLAAPDGSEAGTPLGPEFPYSESAVPDLAAIFSPDGSQVFLLDLGAHRLWTLPIDGRPWTSEPWDSDALPVLQRVGPLSAARPNLLSDSPATPCPGGGGCRP